MGGGSSTPFGTALGSPRTFAEHAALGRAHSISGVVNQKDVSMPARTRHVDVEK